MRYNRLDLNLLPALRAVLKERNVTRAAESIHVTQPAMSAMLARLRDYFDDPLIVPMGRRMVLTPLAEDLAGRLNDLLSLVDATLQSRPGFDPALSKRHYTIVVSDYVVSVLLLGVLKEVDRVAPGISIECRPPASDGTAMLEAGEVDFVVNPDAYTRETQSSVPLFEDTYHAVVDRAHPQVGDSLTLQQYLALPHVACALKGRPLFEDWFERRHRAQRHVAVTANTFGLLAPLVIGTRRVATLHTRLALAMAQQLPVRLVKLDFETPRLVDVLQWHKVRDLDPGSVWLRELIVAHAQRLPPLP
jgi:DNA-binding transcriptional LysR family regulator